MRGFDESDIACRFDPIPKDLDGNPITTEPADAKSVEACRSKFDNVLAFSGAPRLDPQPSPPDADDGPFGLSPIQNLMAWMMAFVVLFMLGSVLFVVVAMLREWILAP